MPKWIAIVGLTLATSALGYNIYQNYIMIMEHREAIIAMSMYLDRLTYDPDRTLDR